MDRFSQAAQSLIAGAHAREQGLVLAIKTITKELKD
jgi:hypothetical protein